LHLHLALVPEPGGSKTGRRGYPPNDIEAIMSGNWLRVLHEALR
jgi:hypothetical protein